MSMPIATRARSLAIVGLVARSLYVANLAHVCHGLQNSCTAPQTRAASTVAASISSKIDVPLPSTSQNTQHPSFADVRALSQRLALAEQPFKGRPSIYTTSEGLINLLNTQRDRLPLRETPEILNDITCNVLQLLELCSRYSESPTRDLPLFRTLKQMMHRARTKSQALNFGLVGDYVDWPAIERHPYWAMFCVRFNDSPQRHLRQLHDVNVRFANEAVPGDLKSAELLVRTLPRSLKRAGVAALRHSSARVFEAPVPNKALRLDWTVMDSDMTGAKERHDPMASDPIVDLNFYLQGLVKTFQEAWNAVQLSGLRSSHIMYRHAIEFEVAMATWRFLCGDAKRNFDAAWEPTRDAIRKAHAQGNLNTIMLNTILRDFYYSARIMRPLEQETEYRWMLNAIFEAFAELNKLRKLSGSRSIANESTYVALQFVLGLSPSSIQGYNFNSTTYSSLLTIACREGMLSQALAVYEDFKMMWAAKAPGGVLSVLPLPEILKLVCAFGTFGAEPSASTSSRAQRDTGAAASASSREPEWTMEQFIPVFEDLLRAKPTARFNASQLDEGSAVEDPDQDGHEQPSTSLAVRTNRFDTSQAPSSRHLFHTINALRRVSGDDVPWVLDQFDRVRKKFGPRNETTDDSGRIRAALTDRYGLEINKEGWKGWRLSSREERLLQWLNDGKPDEED